MSLAMTELSQSTQHLIDARLDTIDRMLLERVSRAERLQIVREVEGQIFEQLQELGQEWSRDDVIAVLARLDPPEAYLPEQADESHPSRSRASTLLRIEPSTTHRRDRSRPGKTAGILGILAMSSLMLLPVDYFIAVALNSEVFLFAMALPSLGFAIIAGILAITLATFARLGNAWSVVGLVTGALSIFALMGLFAFTFLQFT